MSENDHILIQGLVSGKEKSFNILFNDYYLVLTFYARKYVGDIDLSKEIVQDMFVRLYESRNLLKDVTNLKGYLFRSVRNSCLNHIKLNKIHNRHKENIRLDSPGPDYDLTHEIQESELEQRIFKIISKLPERCRQIFKMSRIEGLKNDEIASNLNISKRTVETQISKALKTLRLELAPYLTIFVLCIAYVCP